MTKKILITGCAGFIGSNLVDDLLQSNYKIIGIDNFDNFYSPSIKENNLKNALNHSNFKLYKADITDENSISQILKENEGKIDTIIHLAALAGVRPSFDKPQEYFRVNTEGTFLIFKNAIQHNIKHFIYASSSSVYGEIEGQKAIEDVTPLKPISPYAESKLKAEETIKELYKENDITVNIFRFFTVYGPRQRPDMAFAKFKRLLKEDKMIELYGENISRDFTHISRIIKGIKAGIHYRNHLEIFNLGNGEKVSVREMIENIGNELNIRPAIVTVNRQMGDPSSTLADITKAIEKLKY